MFHPILQLLTKPEVNACLFQLAFSTVGYTECMLQPSYEIGHFLIVSLGDMSEILRCVGLTVVHLLPVYMRSCVGIK